MLRIRAIVWATAATLAAPAAPALGFQIETVATTGCHEHISVRAVEQAGWPAGARPPIDETMERLLDDLPFDIPAPARDALGAALLIGVRHNDIRGNRPTDIPALVHIHNDPDDQMAHCMRRQDDDFGDGDGTALAACSGYIVKQIAQAIGDDDDIDLTATTEQRVFLAFRGRVDVAIPRYGFFMGRALHALQDSFTHAFRHPDNGRVRHVLNWIDYLRSSDYSEVRDGYRHLGHLDDCSLDHPSSQRRVSWAVDASRDLLAAVASVDDDRVGRLRAAEAVLNRYFAIESGCGFEDDFCGAMEPFEPTGCQAAGPASPWPVLLALVLFLGPRVLRRALGPILAVSVAGSLLASGPTAAHAEPAGQGSTIGVHTGLGASVDRAALAGSLAVRWYPHHSRFGLGVDAEYNPWFSIDAGRAAAGVFNAYATLIYRYRAPHKWELRSTAQLGTSVLLFNLIGLDRGSVGIYAALSPLGLSFPITGTFRLVVDPLSISLPIPSLAGFPFYYQQYRATIGLEWYP